MMFLSSATLKYNFDLHTISQNLFWNEILRHLFSTLMLLRGLNPLRLGDLMTYPVLPPMGEYIQPHPPITGIPLTCPKLGGYQFWQFDISKSIGPITIKGGSIFMLPTE